ncbi:unnamed protein product [Rhizoctonia solani]|uniref:Uncharacterized protein n=1 Tax=Rhizoctonia solani TaxID=456999 RepID=A0A8H3HLW3_9AGAM|nr:unnamed protein product [Rhizoctonia solani]
MSRSGGDTGTGLASRKGPTFRRPDQDQSQQATVIQVMTTETVHRDDGLELEEYGFDTKRGPHEDVEAFGQTQAKVQLSGALTSDENSMHSITTFDAK